MGFKDYFRPPISENVQPPEIPRPNENVKPMALKSHTLFSQESLNSQAIAMHRLNDVKPEVMVNHIYSQQAQLLWYTGEEDEGVVLKQSRGQYVCCPPELRANRPDGFFDAIQALNVKSALTINTRAIKIIIQASNQISIPISEKLRLQVLPDVASISRCAKHQFAAFIADRGILVVWDDQPEKLIGRAQALEKGIMSLIWTMDVSEKGNPSSGVSFQELNIGSQEDLIEPPRRIVLLHAITTALTLLLIIVTLGAGYRKICMEIALDHSYIRLALIATAPVTIWISFFFFQALIGDVYQIIGPISQIQSNTKYYSGLPPKRIPSTSDSPLPHVTIQCPVYKEGLQSVIAPTVSSIKAAISTYEMQGGTANIFVNDDGMQLLSREEAQARQEFYEEHSIAWVARPRHDPKGEHGVPFVRRGKFKKASNMNYALWVSNRVEEKMTMMSGSPRPSDWTQELEATSYAKALEEVIAEDENRTWADGNVRIGDFVLLVDSDTRVPTDCLLDAVSEMEHSPQVAITQFSSGVMNVTENFFENGITFFTNLVYTQIKYAIANGDVAPFVGHNAILRWSAVQDIAYDCPDDDSREKYWSEATVSEDFDMALRLQSAGYLVRYAAYFDDGFKEGVSLTVYDELARWEKYAYGCSELLFHPLRYWPTRGPFTKLFRSFIASGMPFPSKLTILSYIGTYYAIGCAWPLTVLNYFIVGWYNTVLDKYYLNSFQVYLSIIVVFTAAGNVALAILRYRLGEQSLPKALLMNLTWIPLLSVFLGGLSLHVSQALVSHLVGIDMNWGATSKEVEHTTFFKEVLKVMRNFAWTFGFCVVMTVCMVVLAVVPEFWRIDAFFAVFPLSVVVVSHALLPVVLNPSLMLFTW